MGDEPLDSCDLRILDALQHDASLSRKQIAERCHISEATCSRRIASLKRRGYLERQVAVLNRRKLGLPITVYVLVTMGVEHDHMLHYFNTQLRKSPYVLDISFISGEYDYLLHVVAPSMDAYHEFAEEHLVKEKFVKKYLSLFEMKSLKRSTALPLGKA